MAGWLAVGLPAPARASGVHDCVCALTARRFPFNFPMDRRPADPLTGWAAMNKPITHLLTDFLPMLKERGVTDADIDTMLRDNPRRLLTGAA